MSEAAHGNRPEYRSALIADELSRLNVDIVALSQACFSGEGIIYEHFVGYTFICSGRPTTKVSFSGASFMVSTSIAPRRENLPTGHSDCMSASSSERNQYPTPFSEYTPTLWAEPAEKYKSYSERKVRLLHLSGDHSALHRRKNPACVHLKRLVSTIAEDHLPETQSRFKAKRGTTDMVFVLRQLQEKCWE